MLLKMLQVVMFLGIVANSHAGWFGAPDWNGLTVTWGSNPFSPKNFNQLPRTEAEANAEKWTSMANGCLESKSYFKGVRYVKNNDPGVMLLFDVNGYIAGMQAGISAKLLTKQRVKKLKHGVVFNLDKDETLGNLMVMTVYFVPPKEICVKGRSKIQFDKEGTGLNLYIQVGPNPTINRVVAPKKEDAAKRLARLWQQGVCLYTMGRHYLGPFSLNMDCDDLYPIFLTYNSGVLDGFGFAYDVINPSPRFERAVKGLDAFLKPVPKCLLKRQVSFIHVFFEKPFNLLFNFC